MTGRIQRFQAFVISLMAAYVVGLHYAIARLPDLHPLTVLATAILTSVGFYRLLVGFLQWVVSANRFAKQMYWGRLYLDGLWSYRYTLSGKEYRGVWRIDQDLHRTAVLGFGVDDQFTVRSRHRSVTDLIDSSGAFDVVNLRSDRVEPNTEYYSKTTVFIGAGTRRKWFSLRRATRLRGRTVIYGGKLSGIVHDDVEFVKHESAESEDEVLDELRRLKAVEARSSEEVRRLGSPQTTSPMQGAALTTTHKEA